MKTQDEQGSPCHCVAFARVMHTESVASRKPSPVVMSLWPGYFFEGRRYKSIFQHSGPNLFHAMLQCWNSSQPPTYGLGHKCQKTGRESRWDTPLLGSDFYPPCEPPDTKGTRVTLGHNHRPTTPQQGRFVSQRASHPLCLTRVTPEHKLPSASTETEKKKKKNKCIGTERERARGGKRGHQCRTRVQSHTQHGSRVTLGHAFLVCFFLSPVSPMCSSAVFLVVVRVFRV